MSGSSSGSVSRSFMSSGSAILRSGASSGWASGVQNTCTATDRHDDACPSFDVGGDHTYAIYMKSGERVTADLTTTTTRCATGEEYRSYLKFKFNAGCYQIILEELKIILPVSFVLFAIVITP